MDAAVHIVVDGVVQGVGFRWFVARQANMLGLRGFVEN
jgi:acylphosphatase